MDLDDWGTLLTVLLILDVLLTGAAVALIAAHRKMTEPHNAHTATRTPRTSGPTAGPL